MASAPGWAFGAFCLIVGMVQVLRAVQPERRALAVAERRLNVLAPPYAVNPYGLFRVMTTQRAEIVVEGSADGRNWKPYEFRYKPGDPFPGGPRFVRARLFRYQFSTAAERQATGAWCVRREIGAYSPTFRRAEGGGQE